MKIYLIIMMLHTSIASAFSQEAVRIFWVSSGDDKIQSSNLDGSNLEDIVSSGLDRPYGIAIDNLNLKLYWSDTGTDKIQRANLDGSNVEDIVTDVDSPGDIELDFTAGKVYWTDGNTKGIFRANLDGSNIDTLVANLPDFPLGLALDLKDGKMYWSNNGVQAGPRFIQWANLDGSNVENLIAAIEPEGIAVDTLNGKLYWVNGGRISGNTFVGDNHIMRSDLGGANPEEIINRSDLGGRPVLARDITLDENSGKIYWTESINSHLGQFGFGNQKIRQANLDGSEIELLTRELGTRPVGIALLFESPPTSISANNSQIPSRFVLDQNYPNPFNPQTTIKYQLPDISKIKLAVYNLLGESVATLVDEEQNAGAYTVTWNGEDDSGRSVASGVYLYRLEAGEFVQVRKLTLVR